MKRLVKAHINYRPRHRKKHEDGRLICNFSFTGAIVREIVFINDIIITIAMMKDAGKNPAESK